MLIKVNTAKHRVCYINPAQISIIDQSPVDPDSVCVVVDAATIWITAAEFARILPLLNGDTPAPAAAQAIPSGYQQAFEDGINHAKTKGSPVREMESFDELKLADLIERYQAATFGIAKFHIYRELRDFVMSLAPAAALPVKVIEAWNEFDKASQTYNHVENDADRTYLNAFNDTRAMFLTRFGIYIESLDKNIPTEETDHE